MGEIAEQLIEEEMFGSQPDTWKEKKSKFVWQERTPAEKKIASIRKEIAIDIQSGTGVGTARQKANLKYGKGWRTRGLTNDQNQWTEEELEPFI